MPKILLIFISDKSYLDSSFMDHLCSSYFKCFLFKLPELLYALLSSVPPDNTRKSWNLTKKSDILSVYSHRGWWAGTEQEQDCVLMSYFSLGVKRATNIDWIFWQFTNNADNIDISDRHISSYLPKTVENGIELTEGSDCVLFKSFLKPEYSA